MTKGEETRTTILQKASELFNIQGYSSASISDVMQATGLQKGGIYNHFTSKEELTLEAFDYGFQVVSDQMMAYLKDKRKPLERLIGIIRYFEKYTETPPVKGGCVLLNASVESDDNNPALRERAQHGMNLWRDLIRRSITKGMAQGEMRPDLDPDTVATLVISMVEGGVLLSRLYGDFTHINRVVEHLLTYVEEHVKA